MRLFKLHYTAKELLVKRLEAIRLAYGVLWLGMFVDPIPASVHL